MKPGPFKAEQFVATQWDTAEDKAKFANHLVRFVESDYSRSLFYKWFYRRLSNCFGHIAHYNLDGFYHEWFTSDPRNGGRRFLYNIAKWPCYGDPKFTYSDVEKELQKWVRLRKAVEYIERDF